MLRQRANERRPRLQCSARNDQRYACDRTIYLGYQRAVGWTAVTVSGCRGVQGPALGDDPERRTEPHGAGQKPTDRPIGPERQRRAQQDSGGDQQSKTLVRKNHI